MAITIVAIAVVLLVAGAAAAAIAAVSWGIRREERDFTLTAGYAPGWVSQSARLLTGLYVRQVISPERGSLDRQELLV
jgi:hypothetical protein